MQQICHIEYVQNQEESGISLWFHALHGTKHTSPKAKDREESSKTTLNHIRSICATAAALPRLQLPHTQTSSTKVPSSHATPKTSLHDTRTPTTAHARQSHHLTVTFNPAHPQTPRSRDPHQPAPQLLAAHPPANRARAASHPPAAQ